MNGLTCERRFSSSGSRQLPPRRVCGGGVQHLPMASLECRSNPPSPATQITPPVVIAQTRMILKEETESKPLQEQLPVTQIKSGPAEDDCQPVIAAPPTSAGANGGTAQPAGVRATILPTVPININLNDLQNVLRRLLGATNRVVTQGKQGNVVQQPQQQIISLPAFVDRDGTRKIIINYRISPAAGKTNPAPLPTVTTAAAPTPTKTEPSTPIKTEPSTPEVTDLSIVKAEPESVAITDTEMEAVTWIQMASDAQTGQVVDSAALDPSFATLLSEAGVKLEEPPVDDLLSLLKTYFASNANPGEEELTKISEAVSIHVDVVRKWFAKMNSGEDVSHYLEKTTAVSSKTESNASNQNGEAEKDSSQDTGDLVIVKTDPEDPDSVDSQAERLDLSVPKRIAAAVETSTPPAKQQEQPLSLTYLKKEQLEARTIYVTKPQNGRQGHCRTAVHISGHRWSRKGALSQRHQHQDQKHHPHPGAHLRHYGRQHHWSKDRHSERSQESGLCGVKSGPTSRPPPPDPASSPPCDGEPEADDSQEENTAGEEAGQQL